MKRRMMALTLLGLLAGCSTAQKLHYYSLDVDSPKPTSIMVQPQHQLVLQPVALSDQINRMSLVYQLEGNELHFAEYHRWAGPLDAQLNQLTLNGLSSRLPGWVVRQDGARKVPVLAISVERFQGRHDGRALLSGRWRLLTEEGVVLRDVPFQQELVLPADGYGSLVDQLGQGWQLLVDHIATELRIGLEMNAKKLISLPLRQATTVDVLLGSSVELPL
ncbi:membrane integrity-associated transporter subunit PqiC [Aeromonas rivipollensis]|uniref:Membrane integrity-associated transporter subunit PqiC n=1 Tax=Aeromonas rivipollensis TaxID=948519 RepID=A0AAW9YCF1_9GAMM|nr:membrane integrity-associated transporter subunit PqiC [Aeromonas rivipollensis]